MSANIVHPAELERRLQERLEAARSKHDPAQRSHGRASRRGFRRGSAGLAVGLVLALTATGVFADGGNLDVWVADKADYAVDTTTEGAIVEYIGDDNTTFGSAGSGVFESFLQTQDTPSEEGYNTDGDKEFDTGSSPTFNHAILVSAIPTVACESLDGFVSTTGLCWELFADINDSNANDPDAAQIQLTQLEIWLTDDAEITGYDQGGTGFGGDADLVYDFEGTVLINDVNQGSGRGDLRYLIPLDGIVLPDNCEFGSAACTTYFVVYTEWGDPADGDYKSDSGFEEWKVKTYPSLQIVKNTVGGDTTFDFAVTGDPTDPPDTSPSITTSGGTGSTPAYVIEEGTYTIDELGPPAGWTLTGAVCSFNGGAAQAYTEGADLEIDDDDHVICTFTNVRMGTIRIIKDAIPNDAQDFDFSATGLSPTSFVLDDDADGTLSNLHTYSNVLPGSYTVTETGETGWDLTDLDCDDDASTTPSTDTGATATINVDPGETVTCTYENSKRPTIIVRKVTTGTAGGPFTFTTTGGNGFTGPFDLTTLAVNTPVSQSFEIAAAGIGGDYTVTESAMPAGFVLTDVDCVVTTAGAPGTTTGQDLATKTGSIFDLSAGTTVTCTFVNSGALTTRTQGFWSTHSWLVELVWSPTGGTIDTFIHDGMTDAERTLCPGQDPLTVEEVMGGFWSNIAKQTDGDKRTKLDQARMQLAQQLLAAILNNQLFGSSPSGITIEQAKAAFCGSDISAIKAAASAMAAFNESGDAGLFTPGGSADAKHARAIADREYWDDLP
jgi:hypothetical protein